jgi:oligopeptidase B
MKSKKYIAIVSEQNGVATEYQLLEASNPLGEFKTFLARKNGHEYYVEHYQDKFFVKTNSGNAINFKLVEVEEKNASNINLWKEKIAHRNDVLLEGIEVFKNHLVIQERNEGLIKLRIIDQTNTQEHYVDFGEPAYDAYIGTNPDFNTNLLRFGYNSLTTPGSTFDYDMTSKTKYLRKEQEILGGFDKKNYKSERFYIKSRDGVNIPVSLVYHKNRWLCTTSSIFLWLLWLFN